MDSFIFRTGQILAKYWPNLGTSSSTIWPNLGAPPSPPVILKWMPLKLEIFNIHKVHMYYLKGYFLVLI